MSQNKEIFILLDICGDQARVRAIFVHMRYEILLNCPSREYARNIFFCEDSASFLSRSLLGTYQRIIFEEFFFFHCTHYKNINTASMRDNVSGILLYSITLMNIIMMLSNAESYT